MEVTIALIIASFSQWIVTQKKSHSVAVATNEKEEALGLSPAYQDSQNLIFGCKHYKRNCKLLAPCCNKLYTCIRCHDELTDHSLDRCEWLMLTHTN